MRWKFGLFWCGARNSLFPELKLSRTVTLFSASSLSTRWLPMKPAPPVTRIDLSFSVDIFLSISFWFFEAREDITYRWG